MTLDGTRDPIDQRANILPEVVATHSAKNDFRWDSTRDPIDQRANILPEVVATHSAKNDFRWD